MTSINEYPFHLKYVDLIRKFERLNLLHDTAVFYNKESVVVRDHTVTLFISHWNGGIKIRRYEKNKYDSTMVIKEGNILYAIGGGPVWSCKRAGPVTQAFQNICNSYGWETLGWVVLGVLAEINTGVRDILLRNVIHARVPYTIGEATREAATMMIAPTWAKVSSEIYFHFAFMRYENRITVKRFSKVKSMSDFVVALTPHRKERAYLLGLVSKKRYESFYNAASVFYSWNQTLGDEEYIGWDNVLKLIPYYRNFTEIGLLISRRVPVERIVALLKWRPTDAECVAANIPTTSKSKFHYHDNMFKDIVPMMYNINVGVLPPGNLKEAHDTLMRMRRDDDISKMPDVRLPMTSWQKEREAINTTNVSLVYDDELMDITFELPLTHLQMIEAGEEMSICVGSSNSYYMNMRDNNNFILLAKHCGKCVFCALVYLQNGEYKLGQSMFRHNVYIGDSNVKIVETHLKKVTKGK